MRRTITITVTRIGNATTKPRGPRILPTIRTDVMVSTGGMSIFFDITSGATRFPSIRWMITPSMITYIARVPPPGPPRTNSAGSTVETSVPKNGTTATRPVNTPNVSQYGTSSR